MVPSEHFDDARAADGKALKLDSFPGWLGVLLKLWPAFIGPSGE